MYVDRDGAALFDQEPGENLKYHRFDLQNEPCFIRKARLKESKLSLVRGRNGYNNKAKRNCREFCLLSMPTTFQFFLCTFLANGFRIFKTCFRRVDSNISSWSQEGKNNQMTSCIPMIHSKDRSTGGSDSDSNECIDTYRDNFWCLKTSLLSSINKKWSWYVYIWAISSINSEDEMISF